MIAILKKIYHRLSSFRVIKKMGDIYCNGFLINNIIADINMKKISHMKHDKKDTVSVFFLCQYKQAWNKIQNVFDKMEGDVRFNPVILAIPEYIDHIDNDVYMYFYKLYGNRVINAYDNGKWYDLQAQRPDYVFYQRPYDQYLPPAYRSNAVSKYAKTWYVDYAYDITLEVQGVCKNKLFFRNIYLYFAENAMSAEFNRKRFLWSHKKGYRKTYNIGYPVFEALINKKTEKRGNDFCILWTPRWSNDKATGGSNFLNYKDEVIKLPQKNRNIFLISRPHPMTRRYFVESGQITEEEMECYLNIYKNGERLMYDEQADYMDTFWNTDVLLTDVSSIIVEFFITGKPIVYCDTGSVPNQFFSEIIKVLYVTDNWQETEHRLLELSKGNDPLKEARLKKIKELMGEDFTHISERFLKVIYDDYLTDSSLSVK